MGIRDLTAGALLAGAALGFGLSGVAEVARLQAREGYVCLRP